MLYITGLYALNLPCSLKTSGDWHTSALNWDNIKLKESSNSIFRDFGIEMNKSIPEHNEKYCVANHIRAILDLLEEKKFDILGNFKDDFICNDEYTNLIFTKVNLLLPNDDIANYMHKIYGNEWRKWIGENNTNRF